MEDVQKEMPSGLYFNSFTVHFAKKTINILIYNILYKYIKLKLYMQAQPSAPHLPLNFTLKNINLPLIVTSRNGENRTKRAKRKTTAGISAISSCITLAK